MSGKISSRISEEAWSLIQEFNEWDKEQTEKNNLPIREQNQEIQKKNLEIQARNREIQARNQAKAPGATPEPQEPLLPYVPEETSYFQEVGEVQKRALAVDASGKTISLRKKQPRTETVILDNGDVQVTFVYPLDNDSNPKNGRIYFYDRFTFDPQSRRLKNFKRDFHYNNRGSNNIQWMGWLREFQKGKMPKQEKYFAFANRVAQSYARPLNSEVLSNLVRSSRVEATLTQFSKETQKAIMKGHRHFFTKISEKHKEIKKEAPNFGWKLKDAQIKTELREDGDMQITFIYPMDDDTDAENGRMFLHDQFIMSGRDGSFKKLIRDFTIAEGFEGQEPWTTRLQEHQAFSDPQGDLFPSSEEQANFAHDVVQNILLDFQVQALESHEYFKPLREELSEEKLEIRISDPRTHYTLIDKGYFTEVIFSYAVEDQNPATRGHLFLQEKFIFQQGMPNEPIGFERKYVATLGSPKGEKWRDVADRLNQNTPNSDAEKLKAYLKNQATPFIQKFLPGILVRKPNLTQGPVRVSETAKGETVELTDEIFEEIQNEMIHRSESVGADQIEQGFYINLPRAQEYYLPLKEALEPDFKLDLGNTPPQVSVRVEGEETVIQLDLALSHGSWDGVDRGKLEFSETFRFKGTTLESIERDAQVLGPDPEGNLAKTRDRILATREEGKFHATVSEATQPMQAILTHFFAPHLMIFLRQAPSEGENSEATPPEPIPPLRESSDISEADRTRLTALYQIQRELIPYLHHRNTDLNFRVRVLRALQQVQFIPGMTGVSQFHQELGALAEEAEAAHQELDEIDHNKNINQDRERLAKVLQKIQRGDIEIAVELAQKIHEPELKKIALSPLEAIGLKKQVHEGILIMGDIARDYVMKEEQESSKWWGGNKDFNAAAELKVVESLLDKALRTATEAPAKSPFEVLRAIADTTEAEAALIKRIIANPTLQKINSVSQDSNPKTQASAYFNIARSDLYDQKLLASAHALAQRVAADKMPKTPGMEGLEILEKLAQNRVANEKMMELEKVQMQLGKEFMGAMFLYQQRENLRQVLQAKLRQPVGDMYLDAHQFLQAKQQLEQATGSSNAAPEEVKAFQARTLQENILQATGMALTPDEVASIQSRGTQDIQQNLAVAEKKFEASPEGMAFQASADASLGVLDKAFDVASHHPDLDPLQILRDLPDKDLNPAELQARGEFLKDPLLQQISALGASDQLQERWRAYSQLVGGLMKNPATAKGANTLLQSLATGQFPQGRGVEGIFLISRLTVSVLEGQASQSIMKLATDQMAQEAAPEMEELEAKFGPQEKMKRAAVQMLFQKAKAHAFSRPGATALDILSRFDEEKLDQELASLKEQMQDPTEAQKKIIAQNESLVPLMKEIRKSLMEDEIAKKFSRAAEDTNPLERRGKYVKILNDPSIKEERLITLGFWLGEQLGSETEQPRIPHISQEEMGIRASEEEEEDQEELIAKLPEKQFAKDVQDFLAVTEGRGRFGAKLEYHLPVFMDELTKPTTLGSFALAGMAGPIAEGLVLKNIHSAGTATRVFAGGIGAMGEGVAFTGAHKLGESAFYSSVDMNGESLWGWNRFAKDAAFNSMLFGGLRAGHGVVGKFSERVLASGKMPKWLGGKFWGQEVYGQAGKTMIETPMGAVRPMMPAGEGAVMPQLTVAGRRLTSGMNHGMGVGGMMGMGYVGRALDLQPQSDQGWQGHLSDAFLMYLQAMIGFNLANGLSRGHLQNFITQVKTRNAMIGRDVTFDPLNPPEVLEGVPQLVVPELLSPTGAQRIQMGMEPLVGSKGLMRMAFQLTPEGILQVFDGRTIKVPEVRDPDATLTQIKNRIKDYLGEETAEGIKVRVEEGVLEIRDNRSEIPEGSRLYLEGNPLEKSEWTPLKEGQKLSTEAEPVEALEINGMKFGPEQWVSLKEGDVLVAGEREFRPDLPLEIPSELSQLWTAVLSQTPLDQQLSLHGKARRSKNFEKLVKKLSRTEGDAGPLMAETINRILKEEISMSELPPEFLGIRNRIEELMVEEVQTLKREGFGIERFELAESGIRETWSPLEIEFYTGRRARQLADRIRDAKTMEEILLSLGGSGFKEVDGIPVETILKGMELLVLSDRFNKLKDEDSASGELAQIEARIQELEVELGSAPGATAYRTQAGEAQQTAEPEIRLPQAAGLRQRIHDLIEAKDYEATLAQEREASKLDPEKYLIWLVKKKIDPNISNSYPQAKAALRKALDQMTSPARIMLRTGWDPVFRNKKMDAILEAYFNGEGAREVASPERALEIAQYFSRAGTTRPVTLNYVESGGGKVQAKLILGVEKIGAKSNGLPLYSVRPGRPQPDPVDAAEVPMTGLRKFGRVLAPAWTPFRSMGASLGASVKGLRRPQTLETALYGPKEIKSILIRLKEHLEQHPGEEAALPHLKLGEEGSPHVFQTFLSHPGGRSELVVKATPKEEGGFRYRVKLRYSLKRDKWNDLPEIKERLQELEGIENRNVEFETEFVTWKSFEKSTELPLEITQSPGWKRAWVTGVSGLPTFGPWPEAWHMPAWVGRVRSSMKSGSGAQEIDTSAMKLQEIPASVLAPPWMRNMWGGFWNRTWNRNAPRVEPVETKAPENNAGGESGGTQAPPTPPQTPPPPPAAPPPSGNSTGESGSSGGTPATPPPPAGTLSSGAPKGPSGSTLPGTGARRPSPDGAFRPSDGPPKPSARPARKKPPLPNKKTKPGMGQTNPGLVREIQEHFTEAVEPMIRKDIAEQGAWERETSTRLLIESDRILPVEHEPVSVMLRFHYNPHFKSVNLDPRTAENLRTALGEASHPVVRAFYQAILTYENIGLTVRPEPNSQ